MNLDILSIDRKYP